MEEKKSMKVMVKSVVVVGEEKRVEDLKSAAPSGLVEKRVWLPSRLRIEVWI